MRRFLGTRKRRVVTVLCAVAVVAGISATWATLGAQAAPDKSAIQAVISGYETGKDEANSVPYAYAAQVQSGLDQLKADPSWKPNATETNPGAHVLPAAAWSQMADTYDANVAKYCTGQFHGNFSNGDEAAASINAGLRNNPQEPVLVQEQTKVLEIQIEKVEGSTCVVWAYRWTGDITTKGHGPEDWSVYEYTLVNDGDSWRIASRAQLVALTEFYNTGERISDAWGPNAPHQSVAERDDQNISKSSLYPDPATFGAHLLELEAVALASK
jgi:hypothetical protein